MANFKKFKDPVSVTIQMERTTRDYYDQKAKSNKISRTEVLNEVLESNILIDTELDLMAD